MEMKWKEYKVDIANITKNGKYQRPLNERWLKQIVKNYDESKVNQLVLSAHPDGTYFVIDGQHTIEATRAVKGDHVLLPAKVFFGLTEEQEADLFFTYNNDRKALSTNDKIRARLARGEADVVDYFDALDYTGIKWSFEKSKSALINHALSLRAFSCVDRNTAVRGMMVFHDAGYINGPILAGLIWFLYKHPEVSDTRLTKKLLPISEEQIRRDSFSVATANGYSAATATAGSQMSSNRIPSRIRIYAKTIAFLYNKGLRDDNKIDLATI